MAPTIPDEFVTAEEVAQKLKMDVAVVCRKARKGELPGTKFGGAWKFSWPEVVEAVRDSGRKREAASC